MSSPAVAGAISLVLSGLRAKLSQVSLRAPFPLWRSAILRSARPIEHLSPLDQGAGVFHVESTFDYLLQSCLIPSCGTICGDLQSITLEGELEKLRQNPITTGGWYLTTKVVGPGCVVDNKRGVHSRGIWLRKGWLPLVRDSGSQSTVPQMAYHINLKPIFSKDVSVGFKRNFSLNLAVTVECDRTSEEKDLDLNKPTPRPPWLQVVPYTMVTNSLKDIPLIIEPNAFDSEEQTIDGGDAPLHPPSKISFSQISFINLDSQQHEVLAQIPITIQLPRQPVFDYANGVHRFNLVGDFHYKQKVCRWFIRIPQGSTGGVLRLRRSDMGGGSCDFTITVVVPTPFGSVLGTGLEYSWNRVLLLSPSAGGVGSNAKMLAYDSASGDYRYPFPIAWVGDTIEVTVAQHWGAQTPNCSLEGSVIFRGLQIEPQRLSFHTSQNHFNVYLRSHFGLESVQWDFKTQTWVLPLKPSNNLCYFLSLGCLDNRRHAIRGTHTLRLEYKFICPFKSATVFLSMRRLTAVLYDANCLEVIYHISDVFGRYMGAGSFHQETSPKYIFTLPKGSYVVTVQILHLDSKKIYKTLPNDGGEYEVLEKLKTAPLLVYFRLVGGDTQGVATSGAYNSHPQLGLEVCTSLATLGLYGTDFAKSYAALHFALLDEALGGNDIGELEEAADIEALPTKGAFMAPPRIYPTVPNLLSAGEAVSTVVGVVHENFAPYATPGSYFQGQLSYYGNKEMSDSVTASFEIIVGTNPNATDDQSTASNVKAADRAVTLQPRDLHSLLPLAKIFFSSNGAAGNLSWTPPIMQNWMSSSGAAAMPEQKPKKSAKGSTINKTTSTSTSTPSWAQLVDSLSSIATADTNSINRQTVWFEVNSAMTGLVEFAKSSTATSSSTSSSSNNVPIRSLIPVTYQGGNPLDIPILIPTLDNVTKDQLNVEEKSTSESVPKETKPKAVTLTRASAIECLAIYGRYLAERLLCCGVPLSGEENAEEERASLDFAFRLLLARLARLIASKSSSPLSSTMSPDDPPTLLQLAFVGGPGGGGGFRADLSISEVEKVRPAYFACYFAHLLVYHSQMPLLSLLTRIALQLDEPSSKPQTLGVKQTKNGFEKASFECASIAFPWMILQLRRMGLDCLAVHLDRQLPMRFPSSDLTCFQRKLKDPTIVSTSSAVSNDST